MLSSLIFPSFLLLLITPTLSLVSRVNILFCTYSKNSLFVHSLSHHFHHFLLIHSLPSLLTFAFPPSQPLPPCLPSSHTSHHLLPLTPSPPSVHPGKINQTDKSIILSNFYLDPMNIYINTRNNGLPAVDGNVRTLKADWKIVPLANEWEEQYWRCYVTRPWEVCLLAQRETFHSGNTPRSVLHSILTETDRGRRKGMRVSKKYCPDGEFSAVPLSPPLGSPRILLPTYTYTNHPFICFNFRVVKAL